MRYSITVARACAQAFGTSEEIPASDAPCGSWNRTDFAHRAIHNDASHFACIAGRLLIIGGFVREEFLGHGFPLVCLPSGFSLYMEVVYEKNQEERNNAGNHPIPGTPWKRTERS